MLDKKKLFVISTCIILLMGNILGLIEDFRGLNNWNLNKLMSYFADYYSFSFAKWYELQGMWRFRGHPGAWYSDLLICDMVLLILGIIASILFYKTKAGKLFLICFFVVIIALLIIITLEEHKFLNSITRDYLPSTWESGIKKEWYSKCLLPRILYFSLSVLSLWMIFLQPNARNED
jgi:hypothetical protein